jgi:hypothetical protein
MPSLDRERLLRHGDRLLRKLDPETWNRSTLEIFPEAFQDQHDNLSLYGWRIKNPRGVFALSERYGALREFWFGDRKRRPREEL